jgi:hypothetical protein
LKLAEISYRQELPMAHLPRSAGTLQALFQLAQNFRGEGQHVLAIEHRAAFKRGPRGNDLERNAGALQLRARAALCGLLGWLAHSGKCPAIFRALGV